jgi:hypothetical protein
LSNFNLLFPCLQNDTNFRYVDGIKKIQILPKNVTSCQYQRLS